MYFKKQHHGKSTRKQKKDNVNKKTLEPDPETLHTADPQENMEGPVSSIVQGIKEKAEDNNEESKEEADKKKEKNI